MGAPPSINPQLGVLLCASAFVSISLSPAGGVGLHRVCLKGYIEIIRLCGATGQN